VEKRRTSSASSSSSVEVPVTKGVKSSSASSTSASAAAAAAASTASKDTKGKNGQVNFQFDLSHMLFQRPANGSTPPATTHSGGGARTKDLPALIAVPEGASLRSLLQDQRQMLQPPPPSREQIIADIRNKKKNSQEHARKMKALITANKSIVTARYEKMDRVGKGSFGQVYKGLDKELNTVVAIKCIDLEDARDEMEDIQFEIAMMSQVQTVHLKMKCPYSFFLFFFFLPV